MRVGTINYCCQSGLGILTKAFWDHGIVNQMFIIEHSRHPTEWQWYPQTTPHCPIDQLDQNSRDLRQFVSGLDVLLCFETPFYWPIVDYARKNGVKTVCVPMYECSLQNPPALFDEYWCPSMLDLRYFSDTPERIGGADTVEPFSTTFRYQGAFSTFTPVPVKVEWQQRTEAKVFIHNAGHGGLKGRNGTKELVEALKYIKTSPTIVINSQSPIDEQVIGPGILPGAKDLRAERDCNGNRKYDLKLNDVSVTLQIGTRSDNLLYSEGDVFIFPEKFNGLSLPLQEARAAGMLVMATSRYPMTTWLPSTVPIRTWKMESYVGEEITECLDPLIPTVTTVKNRIGPPYMEFDEAVIDPRAIAAKIDEWYGRDLTNYSLSGKEWAESMSWEKLGPKYLELLERLK